MRTLKAFALLTLLSSLALAGTGDGTGTATVTPSRVLAGSGAELMFVITAESPHVLADFAIAIPAGWRWTGRAEDVQLGGSGCPNGKPRLSGEGEGAQPYHYIEVGRNTGAACEITPTRPVIVIIKNLIAQRDTRFAPDEAAHFRVFTWGAASNDEAEREIARPVYVESAFPYEMRITVSPSPARPASTASVTARVLDERGQPVSGAGVEFTSPAGSFEPRTGATGPTGEVTLLWRTPPNPGTATIQATTRTELSNSLASFNIFKIIPVQLSPGAPAGPASVAQPTALIAPGSLPVPAAPGPEAPESNTALLVGGALVVLAALVLAYLYLKPRRGKTRAEGRRRR
jgi:hypothetical protein